MNYKFTQGFLKTAAGVLGTVAGKAAKAVVWANGGKLNTALNLDNAVGTANDLNSKMRQAAQR